MPLQWEDIEWVQCIIISIMWRDGVGSGRARDFCFRSDENINISMRSQWVFLGREPANTLCFTFTTNMFHNRSLWKWMFLVFWGLYFQESLSRVFQDVSWWHRIRWFLLRWGWRGDSRLATAPMFYEKTTQGGDRRIEAFGTNMANERASELL